jgi:hypothetical protein
MYYKEDNMNDLRLRLNEIKFSNAINNFLLDYDVTKLKEQLDTLNKLVEHPNPLALGNAWMRAMAGELDYTFDEIVVLLYNRGMSKNAIRRKLHCSPNKVYDTLDRWEDKQFPIKPKLSPEISQAVTDFIEGLEEFFRVWADSINKEAL